MTIAHLRWMLCCLLCFVLLACHPAQRKEPSPVGTRPSKDNVIRTLPSDFAAQPERVTPIPGRIRASFAEKLLRQEFVPKQGDKGLERLNMTPDLKEILRCYDLKRVWRSMAELEDYENGRVRIVSYAERVRERWKTHGMRANARPYDAPDLSSAAAMLEMEFPPETNMDLLLKDLRKVSGVLSAEQVVVPIPDQPYLPNDPGWVDPSDPIYDATLARGRWGFHNTGAELFFNYLPGFDINLPEAWEYQRGNPSVTVAVLDNGVDVTHPDLYKNIYLNNGEVPSAIVMTYRNASTEDGLPDALTFYDLNVPSVVDALSASGFRDTNGNGYIDGEDVVGWWSNGVDEDSNGYVDDLVGWDFADGNNRPFDIGEGEHGTPVSGLIAAMADNRIGISGVAPRVRLLPIRSAMNIAEITYVLGFNSVRVMNCSLSWPFQGTMIAEIIRTLEPEGVLFVASLGNTDAYYFGSDPSRREEIMSISNFTPQGRRDVPEASGYGPKTDVAAPGGDLQSLSPRTATQQGSTQWFGGTSAASPVTAGVAALIASQNELLTPEQIRQVIRMTASDPAPVLGDRGENTPGWDLYSGWGLVDASRAIADVRSGTLYPEANILSLMGNSWWPREQFAVYLGLVPITAYLGLPRGGTVDWTLRQSTNWDMSGSVVIASGTGASYSDGSTPIHTLNTDELLDNRYVLELEARTPEGVVSKDRAAIDLPHAYIGNLNDRAFVIENTWLEGYAFGPGFSQYQIFIAPGWMPTDADFRVLWTSTSQASGLTSLGYSLGYLNIFGLPVTLPPTGEATLRLVTTGVRTWTTEVRVRIHNMQPPSLSGFPLPGYWSSSSPPMAVDLDGDGTKEFLTAGRGFYDTISVHTLTPTGTTFGAWPVVFPINEFLVGPIAVGDIDNDGRPELVLRTRSTGYQEAIRIFSHNGVEVSTGWPVRFDGSTLSYTPAPVWMGPVLADVTLDGELDILISIPKSPPGVPAVQIRAYQGDGSLIREYTTSEPGHDYLSRPAVGDLDGDGENELVAVASRGSIPIRLYVWHLDGSIAWSAPLGFEWTEWADGLPPVLVDVDGDEHLDVVASGSSTNVKVFRSDGTVLAEVTNYNNAVRSRIVPMQLHPAGDPTERRILFTTRESQAGRYGSYLRMFDLMTGGEPTGWVGGVRFGDADPGGEPVVANMTGDASLEIGYGNDRPYPVFEPSPQYTLAVGTSAGTLLSEGGIWPLVFPGPVKVTPLVTDLDGDGYLDLFVQADGTNAKVHGYALGTPVAPGCIAWGEEAHDVRRSGNYHGDLTLLSPSTLHVQMVGPPADLATQSLLLVRTRFTRGSPAGSTDRANWSVRIGTINASIRDVRLIQGEHWLLVDPVAQPAVGRYKLRVQYNDGGILTWDAYRDAVEYSLTPRNHTQVTIIDRSFSMHSDGKIEAARNAGRYLSESTYPADQVGVVSFANYARDDLGMGVVVAGTNRRRIATAVTSVLPEGPTSMGAGINEGIHLLLTSADVSNRWAFVLLSDGHENIPPSWRALGTNMTVQPWVATLRMAHPDFQIHTVALGPDADEEVMQEIASTTGGVYYPVYLGHSLSLVNRLADVYHSAREQIDGTRRLLTWGDEMSHLQSWEGSVSLPRGARRLQFALNWDQQIALPPSDRTGLFSSPLRLEIQRPDGSLLNPSDAAVEFTANQSDVVYTIPKPMPGIWTVRISNPTKVRIEALLCASAAIPLRLDVFIRPIGLSGGSALSNILASVVDAKGFVTSLRAMVEITRPDKKIIQIRLEDDGKHGDGVSNDGVYGARVEWQIPGSYLVRLTIDGKSSLGAIQVSQTVGYYNKDGTDRDLDGLPDDWERKYCRGCTNGLDPRADPDHDGLDNEMEWRFGTDPFKPDSDGDGRTDGEEVKNGTDPMDPKSY